MKVYRLHKYWRNYETTTYAFYSSHVRAKNAKAEHIGRYRSSKHKWTAQHDSWRGAIIECFEVEISKTGILDALNTYANNDDDNSEL